MAMNAPRSAPASGRVILPNVARSQLVLAGGVLLIVANLVAAPATRTILTNVFKSPGKATPLESNWKSAGWQDLLLQAGVILVLFVLADISDDAGALAVAVLAAMWLVFLVRYADVLGIHN